MASSAKHQGMKELEPSRDPIVMVNMMSVRARSLDGGNGSGWDAYLRLQRADVR